MAASSHPNHETIARRLEGVGTALLADVLDVLGHRSSYLGPGIGPLDRRCRLAGPAVTIRCDTIRHDTMTRSDATVPGSDYHALFEVLRDRHDGGVLLIVGAEHRSGLWGELLSTAAVARGVAGVVVDGLTRDVTGIGETGLRVFARGVSPLDSAGRQRFAEHGCSVRVGDATIEPGDWIVGDELGVIAVPAALLDEALALAEAKAAGESTVRDELRSGDDLRTVFDRHGIL